METNHKTQITNDLRAFCELKGSQNKAANSLKGVSSATISLILSGKTEAIADDMFRNIEAQLRLLNSGDDWNVVETNDFKTLFQLFEDSKKYANVYGIIGDPGTSKTTAVKTYTRDNDNVFRLSCSEFWNKKYFLQELLQSMGRDSSGLTVSEMMNEAIYQILKRQEPIIILDEADKLTDQVLYFFITLYNKLEDNCGIILIATDHLKKRIEKGIKINKKGYKEIYSRMGRKFVELSGVSKDDVSMVCKANGIDDSVRVPVQTNRETVMRNAIEVIWNDCEGDLRRVKRKIHAIKQMKLNATAA